MQNVPISVVYWLQPTTNMCIRSLVSLLIDASVEDIISTNTLNIASACLTRLQTSLTILLIYSNHFWLQSQYFTRLKETCRKRRVIFKARDGVRFHPHPFLSSLHQYLFAVASAVDKGTVRILAPTRAVLRALDAASALARGLASIAPEEGPLVSIALHRRSRRAGVCLACAVGVAVVAIILMVLGENGKGLLA